MILCFPRNSLVRLISNKKGFVIRPLLCFDSAEISRYAADNHIKFREDASNTDTKYIRNAIRHQVIPTLEEVNPSFIATIVASSQQFLELEEILNQKIETEKNSLFVPNKTGFKIDIEALKKLTPLKTYLYYFLKPFNFNAAIVLAIIKGLDAQSGLVFYSATHQIVKDRTHLLLHEITANETKELEIKSLHELPFNYELAKNNVNFTPKRTSNFAYLDIDKLQFPLLLRTWKEGDYFQPFGMQGTRKVSDFLIDNKVSMVDKKSVKVLISAGKIVWLVGHRIDHKYSILDTTKTILTLSVKEE